MRYYQITVYNEVYNKDVSKKTHTFKTPAKRANGDNHINHQDSS